MIHHQPKFTAGFENAEYVTNDLLGVRGVVNHTPGPHEIEFVVGKIHDFGVHLAHISLQAAQLKPLARAAYALFRQVDAR